MSARVMANLSRYTPDVENYSIDESFLDLTGFEWKDLHDYGKRMAYETKRNSGIPVSIGIAPSKTLAKVATRFAKKYPAYESSCVIDTEERIIKALKLTDIGDIWGIGRQYGKRLKSMGVNTAYDFIQVPHAWIRKNMTVVGERMWRELQGESCLPLELIPPDKKEICVANSFGNTLSDITSISEALSTYVSTACRKLCKQKSCASSLMVFLHTSEYSDIPQYHRNIHIKLPVPTSSTLEIVKYALRGLETIYENGYKFKKVGIVLTELISENRIQDNLFYGIDHEKHGKLMKTLDELTAKYGRSSVKLAVQGQQIPDWRNKQERLSPCYTTRWRDVMHVK